LKPAERTTGTPDSATGAKADSPQKLVFSIAVFGGAAAGAEVLAELIGALPEKAGLAYVVVEPAASRSALPDGLHPGLAEAARMPVVAVTEGRILEPDRLYSIAAGTRLGRDGDTSMNSHKPAGEALQSHSAAAASASGGTLAARQTSHEQELPLANSELGGHKPGAPVWGRDPSVPDSQAGQQSSGLAGRSRRRISQHPALRNALDRILEKSIEGEPQDGQIRIWVAGCSSGEDAYSIGIAVLERLRQSGSKSRLQVLGTDARMAEVERARAGIYPAESVEDLPAEQRDRYFTRAGESYRAQKALREICMFARYDLGKDPPVSEIDLVDGRAALDDLDEQSRLEVLRSFHRALHPGGLLLLSERETGKRETLDQAGQWFHAVDPAAGIFARNADAPGALESLSARKPEVPLQRVNVENFAATVDEIVRERLSPGALVVDRDLNVLHFQGNVAPFLAPATGAASLNIFKLIREDLVADLRAALEQCQNLNQPVKRNGIALDRIVVDLEVLPLPWQDGAPPHYLVLLSRALGERSRSGENEPEEAARLRQELEAIRQDVRTLIRAQEAAHAETRAAYNKLLAAHQELRTANEQIESDRDRLRASNVELERRNRELEQAAADMSGLLQTSQIPMVLLSRDLLIRRFTPKASELLNLIPGDIGRPVGNVKPNLEEIGLDAVAQRALAEKNQIDQEVRGKDGHWYLLQARPFTSPDQQTEGVCLTLLDIDPVKREVDRAQRLEQEAIIDRDLSSTLLDLAGALMVIRDEHGNITAFNRAAQEVSGYAAADILGKPIWDLMPPDAADQARAIFNSLRQGAAIKRYETQWIRKDGTRRTIVWSSISQRDATGAVKRVVSIGLDITARKQAEDALRTSEERYRRLFETLQRYNAELKRANENLNQFAYSASHDLQEPLRMVAIYSQLLLRRHKEELGGDGEQYLSYILQGTKRMELLLKSLLEYAQAVNVPEGEVAPVEAGAVLQKALSNLAAAIQESGATITYGALPKVLVPEVHLLQLFQNLIGNAIKYRGKEPLVVRVDAEKRGPEWLFHVRDNGIGIPSKYSEIIFGVFKRLHTGSEYAGAGIGLAICQAIVERYGGRIWVESEEGKGATFSFTLPGGE
jgi:two-component system CheB/CheR fusion protein